MIAGPPVLAYQASTWLASEAEAVVGIRPTERAIAPMVVMVSRLSRLRRLVIFDTLFPSLGSNRMVTARRSGEPWASVQVGCTLRPA